MVAHHIIKTIRHGNTVKRWHTRRMHHYETVGEHTANVLTIIFALCHDRNPSAALIGAALMHDTAEQWTGDVPATAKWEMPILKENLDALEEKMMAQNWLKSPNLTEEEKLTLKWADMLDLCYTCVGELSMGNRTISEVFDRGVEYLKGLAQHKVGLQLLEDLLKERKYVV
jgi:5'-deoxynucleotidase YfbR-like HD superfamily hydrolase